MTSVLRNQIINLSKNITDLSTQRGELHTWTKLFELFVVYMHLVMYGLSNTDKVIFVDFYLDLYVIR